jgi:hypothetical protein
VRRYGDPPDYRADRMKGTAHSRWPLVFLLALCVSVLVGAAVAVAEPAPTGRPRWRETEPSRVTGTVLTVEREDGVITLDSLVTYDPVRAGVGVLTVDVPATSEAWSQLRTGDTVDVVIERHDGRWVADEVVVLDTD